MFDRRILTKQARFNKGEIAALQVLRTQYLTTCHEFTDRELANLRFMRWLVRRPDWNRALDQPVRDVVVT
jgi:hypothetical protein